MRAPFDWRWNHHAPRALVFVVVFFLTKREMGWIHRAASPLFSPSLFLSRKFWALGTRMASAVLILRQVRAITENQLPA